MTAERIAELRAVLDGITPGKWILLPELCGPDGQGVYHADSLGCICEVGDPYPRGDNCPQENMEFIAAAPSIVRELLDALEAIA